MPVVIGMYVPFTLDSEPSEVVTRSGGYTKEELDAAEQQMKKKAEASRREIQNMEPSDLLRKARRPFLWITWIPWLLLAVFVRPVGWFPYAATYSLPLGAAALGLLLPVELVSIALASVASFVLYVAYKKSKKKESWRICSTMN